MNEQKKYLQAKALWDVISTGEFQRHLKGKGTEKELRKFLKQKLKSAPPLWLYYKKCLKRILSLRPGELEQWIEAFLKHLQEEMGDLNTSFEIVNQ